MKTNSPFYNGQIITEKSSLKNVKQEKTSNVQLPVSSVYMYQNRDKFTKPIDMRCLCSKPFNMINSLYHTTFSFSVFNSHDLFCLFFFYCYSTSFIWRVDFNHI